MLRTELPSNRSVRDHDHAPLPEGSRFTAISPRAYLNVTSFLWLKTAVTWLHSSFFMRLGGRNPKPSVTNKCGPVVDQIDVIVSVTSST